MTLTDGTYVAFVTCAGCVHTQWVALNGPEAGTRLTLEDVLVHATVHKVPRPAVAPAGHPNHQMPVPVP
jgi:hypothetical protein